MSRRRRGAAQHLCTMGAACDCTGRRQRREGPTVTEETMLQREYTAARYVGLWVGAKLQHGGRSAAFQGFELWCGIGRGPALLWCLRVSLLDSSRPDFHFCQQQESTDRVGI